MSCHAMPFSSTVLGSNFKRQKHTNAKLVNYSIAYIEKFGESEVGEKKKKQKQQQKERRRP